MKDFNELKDNIIKAAAGVADKTIVFAKKAGDTTKTIAKITKLSADAASERDTIRKNYSEIGRVYYQLNKDAIVDEGLQQLFFEIKASEEKLESIQTQVDDLKAELKREDPDVEVDFFVDDDAEPVDGIVADEIVKAEEAAEEPVAETEQAPEAEAAPEENKETEE